jgi:hypothetical protein
LNKETESLSATIKNEGSTAAFNVTHWWRARLFRLPIVPSDVISYRDTDYGISVDLGPGGELLLDPIRGADNQISPVAKAAADSGSAEIYVWGLIKYRDIFIRCQSNQFAYRYFKQQWFIVKYGNSTTDPVGKEGCSKEEAPRSTYRPPDISVFEVDRDFP